MFDEEAVIIVPTANEVLMLDAVGTRIWILADGQRTVEEIAEQLTDEYDVSAGTARQRVAEFVDELVDRQLLDWA